MDSNTISEIPRKQKKLRENIVINSFDVAERLFVKKCLEKAGLIRLITKPNDNHGDKKKPDNQISRTYTLKKSKETVWDQGTGTQFPRFIKPRKLVKDSSCMTHLLAYKIKSIHKNDCNFINANDKIHCLQPKEWLHLALAQKKEGLDSYDFKTRLRRLNPLMQAVYELIKESITINGRSNEQDISLTLSIDIRQLKQDNLMPNNTHKNPPNYKQNTSEDTCKYRKCELNKRTTVAVIQQTPYRSINKFNFILEDSFRTIFCSHSGNSSKKVSTLRFSNWYFLNMVQGYLITVFLRSTNVTNGTLKLMRGPYFVVIRIDNPNLNIDVNFSFRGDPLLAGIKTIKFPSDFSRLINWNDQHERILLKFRQGLPEDRPKQRPSNIYCLATTTDRGGAIKRSTDSKLCRVCWAGSATLQSTGVGSSILIGGRKDAATTTSVLKSYPTNKSKLITDTAVGCDSMATIHEASDVSKLLYSYCGPVFQKATNNSRTTCFTSPRSSCYSTCCSECPNESCSESMSREQCWQRIFNTCMNPNFYSLFFKCMGHTIGCTLVSVLLSVLTKKL